MTIAEQLLAELDAEARTTKKFLERVPDDKLAWRPHEKSMTAGQLALHIAQVPGQVAQMASADVLPMPDFSGGNPQPKTTREVLCVLEESLSTARSLMLKMNDERMQGMWRLQAGGQEVLAMPRAM